MQRPGVTRNRESFHSKYYLWKPVKGDFSYTERERLHLRRTVKDLVYFYRCSLHKCITAQRV